MVFNYKRYCAPASARRGGKGAGGGEGVGWRGGEGGGEAVSPRANGGYGVFFWRVLNVLRLDSLGEYEGISEPQCINVLTYLPCFL